ncbi:MAG: aminoglycoside phosphotransferase family protein [Gammaproteobacteria bacterium]|nr:aminoglycoside phosphotransferase family protein [Gammaproteobacteria bacterium]
MPDLARLLDETNLLLTANGLPACHSLAPVKDGDTANPNAIAYSAGRKYVVKVTQRHPDTLERQLEIANALRDATDLPIPRHYCCANERGRLPLMIMEWLPGEQLRTVLAAAEHEDLRELCAGLAVCLATFHDPTHMSLVSEKDRGLAPWFYRQTIEALRESARASRPDGAGSLDAVAVRCYLDARFDDVTAAAIPSLGKADQDLRDFLVDPTTFEITGMLDWERVTRGDGIYALTLIFFRLWVNRKLDGWPVFCDTYNRLATLRAEQCPHAEFYLMCRAVLAQRFTKRAKEIVDLLLQGQRLPFEDDQA